MKRYFCALMAHSSFQVWAEPDNELKCNKITNYVVWSFRRK